MGAADGYQELRVEEVEDVRSEDISLDGTPRDPRSVRLAEDGPGARAVFRVKVAAQGAVIHDALAFRAPLDDHEAINAQLKIAIAYRLPGQYIGEYGPRKRASMAARNFLRSQMTKACCTLSYLAEHASYDSIDSGQEQLGSFWSRIHEKLIGDDSVENLIRFVLAVNRAKENGRCPLTVADLIHKSLTPLIIIQVRRQ
jgi:hypothetical protein